MNEQKPIRLHFGCGEKYLEGYINIDFPPSEHTVIKVKADLYADFRTLEYQPETVDEIRCHHVFEHFSRVESLKLLLQWRCWLKVGGVFCIETPDFRNAIKYYLLGGFKQKCQIGRHIFGSQEAGWAFHKDFWDRSKFQFILTKLGFEGLRFRAISHDLAAYFNNPLLNWLGYFLPLVSLRKFQGKKLPNITVIAKKSAKAIDERKAVQENLSLYLVGREGDELLDVWMREVFGP